MNEFDWSREKNTQLQQTRGVMFEDVIDSLSAGGLLVDMEHPDSEKYGHQRIMVVEIENYAYVIPYVTDSDGIKFLKTIYPSRTATKIYLT